MIEQYFTCPHCWEEQFKWVDGSVPEQEFIEDCVSTKVVLKRKAKSILKRIISRLLLIE
ncbi:MAG: CPXCG motif-containing cysteine-rich protein [Flavobacteriaceae bacterium]|nr:CPXCG motif-containing cysteine-rich protein [Flavobacteriaceae bacterium]